MTIQIIDEPTREAILPSVSILGVPVSVLDSREEAVRTVGRSIASRRRSFCVAINPEKVYRSRHDPKLREAIEAADLRICDGIGVSLASWLLHGRRLSRCTGIELFLALVSAAAREGWRVFLLGASPQSNALACRRLVEQHPGLRIAGSRDGYFMNSDAVVKEINRSGADLLFVAMGSPRQEVWIREHRSRLRVAFAMGIGGSLDVVSGTARWAPAAFRRTGTEWLFRLLSQPSRLRRQMVLPLFTVEVLKTALGR